MKRSKFGCGRRLSSFCFVAASVGAPAIGEGLNSLEIATSTGRHVFQVEIANGDATPRARSHGPPLHGGQPRHAV